MGSSEEEAKEPVEVPVAPAVAETPAAQPAGVVTAKPASGAGYDVARPRGVCVVCQSVVEPDQALMAALRETPEGFERLDICLTCWPAFARENLLGFWRTVMPRHEQKKKLFVDDAVLCQLFERLQEVEEPAKVAFRFVLGLILMRKRLIVLESSRAEPEREIWTVRFRGKDVKMELINPNLTEQQIIEVSGQLGQVLNEEL